MGKYSKYVLVLLICGLLLSPLLAQIPVASANGTGLAMPGAIQVATQGALNVSASSAMLTGTLLSMGGHPSVQVAFEWGSSQGYGHQTPMQTMNGAGAFNTPITGLTPGMTYNFRALAIAGLGQAPVYGTNMVFTTPSSQPIQIITSGATQVSSSRFVLHSDIHSKGPYSQILVWFEWGTTTGYGNSTPRENFSDIGPYSFTLIGLAQATTYHFRAAATGGMPGAPVVYGNDLTFTTPAPQPIVVTTQGATDVTVTGATMHGYIGSTGGSTSVITLFEWGTTTSYGNTTPEHETGVGPFSAPLAGLPPGVTYHYRAIAMSAPTGATPVRGQDMTFTTGGLTVSTGPATNVTSNAAVLNGTLQSFGGLPGAEVGFEYGETTNYGTTTQMKTASAPGSFSTQITGLRTGVTYHFRAVATSGTTSPAHGNDSTFITSTQTLSVNTGPATAITDTSAVLVGNLNSLGSYTSAQTWFDWGTDTSLISSTPRQTANSPGVFNAPLNGLIPGMTYYYRAAAQAPLAGAPIAYGAVNIFTTLAPQVLNVVTEKAEGISATSATLNGLIVSVGTGTPLQAWFEYGTNQPYPSTAHVPNLYGPGNFNAYITGLKPNTTYLFRAAVAGPPGSTPIYGLDLSFTTAGQAMTAVSTLDQTEVTTDSARLNGFLTSLGSYQSAQVWFEYGTDMSYGNLTPGTSMTLPGSFNTVITGLKPGTVYHFRAGARTGNDNYYGSDEAFATQGGIQPRVSTEPVSRLRGNTATLNGQLISVGDQPGVQAWFEWGTSVSYGNSTPPRNMSTPGAFEADVSGLSSGATYHYRAVVTGTGSRATVIRGSDIAFSTAPEPPKPSLTVVTGPASGITTSSASISGNIPSLGEAKSAQVYFEWGVSSAYGNATPPQTVTRADAFNATISSLNPGTTYYYRAVVIGPTGPVQGGNVNFTTVQEAAGGLFSCAKR